jgi:hypothetical protein
MLRKEQAQECSKNMYVIILHHFNVIHDEKKSFHVMKILMKLKRRISE